MFLSSSILFLVLVSGELASAALPDYVKVCKRDQETINECVMKSIDLLHPYLQKGIPEMNVPSVDPFKMKEIKVVSGELEALHLVLNNVEVFGLGKFEIKHVDVDLDAMVFKARVSIPEVDITGRFSVDAQILALPFKGEGPLSTNMSDVDVTVVMKYKLERRDGKDYVQFSSCDAKLQLKDYHISITGLQGELGEVAEKLVYENKRELLQVLTPYLQNTIGHMVLQIANHIAASAPYDELLPKP